MKYMFRVKEILFNPFYLFAVSFILSLLLYPLNWIQYPTLSSGLIAFIFCSIVFSIFLGSRYKSKIKKSDDINLYILNVLICCSLVFVSAGFLITFFNAGLIPFLQIILQTSAFDYRHGFDKILYVTALTITLNGAILILCTYLYVQTRKILYVVFFIIAFLWLVLYGNRAYAISVLLPSLILVINAIHFNWFRIISVGVFLVVIIYLFGVYGDKREAAKKNNTLTVYEEMHTENYPEWLAEEFIWGYLYFTSPIAKLEYITRDPKFMGQKLDLKTLIISETLPKSFSKRVNVSSDDQSVESDYGFPSYFVGTAFANPFMRAGWLGMIIYELIFFALIGGVLYVFKSFLSILYLPIVAILSSMAALSIFDNMLTYSLINFILYWLIIIGISYKVLSLIKFAFKNGD